MDWLVRLQQQIQETLWQAKRWLGGVTMHFPHNIIIQYTSFRSSTTPSTVNYHILYDENKEVFEKIDLKNMLSIGQPSSNLLLKLDVDIYDLSIEVIILGILNNLFAQSLPIENINILTN